MKTRMCKSVYDKPDVFHSDEILLETPLHWDSCWLFKMKKRKWAERAASSDKGNACCFSVDPPHLTVIHQGRSIQELNFSCNTLFHVLHDPGGPCEHRNQYQNADFLSTAENSLPTFGLFYLSFRALCITCQGEVTAGKDILNLNYYFPRDYSMTSASK